MKGLLYRKIFGNTSACKRVTEITACDVAKQQDRVGSNIALLVVVLIIGKSPLINVYA